MGTEFEYTRNVDKKGHPVDPFVPKFDIMKAKDLNKFDLPTLLLTTQVGLTIDVSGFVNR